MKRIFTSLLPVCLALVSFGAVADGVEGASTNNNTLVDLSNTWRSPISTTVNNLPAGNNACAVTCAATFINPDANTTANYELGIGNNSFVPPGTSQKVISFPAGQPDDAGWGPIATTHLFSGLAVGSDYIFRCLAHKLEVGGPNATVENASITVSCGLRL